MRRRILQRLHKIVPAADDAAAGYDNSSDRHLLPFQRLPRLIYCHAHEFFIRPALFLFRHMPVIVKRPGNRPLPAGVSESRIGLPPCVSGSCVRPAARNLEMSASGLPRNRHNPRVQAVAEIFPELLPFFVFNFVLL